MLCEFVYILFLMVLGEALLTLCLGLLHTFVLHIIIRFKVSAVQLMISAIPMWFIGNSVGLSNLYSGFK